MSTVGLTCKSINPVPLALITSPNSLLTSMNISASGVTLAFIFTLSSVGVTFLDFFTSIESYGSISVSSCSTNVRILVLVAFSVLDRGMCIYVFLLVITSMSRLIFFRGPVIFSLPEPNAFP